MLKFYGYKNCDTCRRAKKWLESKGHKLEEIDITSQPPSLSALKKCIAQSGKPLKEFLNKSGQQYRALNMKEKVKTLSGDELLGMLAREGRLLKRPLVTDGKQTSVGFDEREFQSLWK